jgi:hypothetical protein
MLQSDWLRSQQWYKYSRGVGRASVAMDHAYRQLIAKKLHAGKHHRQICSELGVSRSLVFKIKKLEDHGQDLTPRLQGGSKRTVQTVAAIARVRRAVAANPPRSVRQLARLHKMDSRTMRRSVREDLGLESRVIVQRLLLTTAAQEMRKERCQKLINKLKASQPRQVRIFSDEKIFTVDLAVNADVYQALLRKHVVPWIKRTYPDGNYVFQQDSALAHTARTTQEFLRETMAEFWTPVDWPPYSPDLNLLDFSVWSVLQEKVQATPHTSFAALRRSITRQWDRMSPAYVRRTCRSFRRRLESVVAKNGSYIE